MFIVILPVNILNKNYLKLCIVTVYIFEIIINGDIMVKKIN